MFVSTMAVSTCLSMLCPGLSAQPAESAEPPTAADVLPAESPTADSAGIVDVSALPILESPDPVEPIGTVTGEAPPELDRLAWHVPDPGAFLDEALNRASKADAALKARTGDLREAKADKIRYEKLAEHLRSISQPRKRAVTLAEVLHRALANSYAIRIDSYAPAISTTDVVAAEATFDATFFATMGKNIQNVPSASPLQGTNIDTLDLEGGVRQLLPSGMQVSTGLSLRRASNDFVFQILNPQYDSQFTVKFRQPFLRGFGLDFNRSQINLAKNDRRISDQAFARQVQDTLRDVETAYWRLFQARRLVAIQARQLATFEQIYNRLEQRGKFDVIPIQINETKARLESSRADFIRICKEVRNAEDVLIALLNDPTVDLADEIELIPCDTPTVQTIVVDRLSEVQSALDHRQEITEAKIQVDSAKILVGTAKNQALPQLDLIFQYAVDGLGKSADRAFDEVTKNDFHEYFIGVELELPVGNRARRAALRKRQLQHGQAIAGLKQVFEQIILDVNVRIRELQTQYKRIGPNFESAEAGEAQVESIRARAEAQNYIQLNNELNAVQRLAINRTDLLKSLVEYNIAIIELERAKGTLLDYYNVAIPQTD